MLEHTDNEYKVIESFQKNIILKNITLFLLKPLGVKVAKTLLLIQNLMLTNAHKSTQIWKQLATNDGSLYLIDNTLR